MAPAVGTFCFIRARICNCAYVHSNKFFVQRSAWKQQEMNKFECSLKSRENPVARMDGELLKECSSSKIPRMMTVPSTHPTALFVHALTKQDLNRRERADRERDNCTNIKLGFCQ